MRPSTITLLSVTALFSVLAGCASGPKEKEAKSQSNVPDWIMTPSVENGIAASECVKSSGDLSIDKSKGTALGRQALAQQIDTRVESMEKTYQRSVDASDDQDSGQTFVSVSKQLAEQNVRGSRIAKAQYVDIGGERNFCTMVTMNPEKTRDLFDQIVQQSDRDVPPESEETLYEQFKAKQAQQELNEEMEENS